MKELSLNSGSYLLVEVPNDAFEFKTMYEDKYTTLYAKFKSKPDNNPYSDEPTYDDWHHVECILETSRTEPIPELEIIAMTNMIAEEECDKMFYCWVVNDTKFYENFMPYDAIDFRDIIDNSFYTAKESLRSLIESMELDVDKNYLILKKVEK